MDSASKYIRMWDRLDGFQTLIFIKVSKNTAYVVLQKSTDGDDEICFFINRGRWGRFELFYHVLTQRV